IDCGEILFLTYIRYSNIGGVLIMATKKTIESVKIEDIRASLENRIDTSNPVEMEKLERYIDYIETYRRMSKIVKKEGKTKETINDYQRYVNAHPLHNEMNKVNNSIMNTEKTFNFLEEKEDDTPTAKDLI